MIKQCNQKTMTKQKNLYFQFYSHPVINHRDPKSLKQNPQKSEINYKN